MTRAKAITQEIQRAKQAALARAAQGPRKRGAKPDDPKDYLGPMNDFPPAGGCLAIRGDPGATPWQCCGRPRQQFRPYCPIHVERFIE